MIKAREALAIAESIVSKALQRQALVYVYLDGQEVKFTSKHSIVFERAQAAGFPNAIGIYNRRCDPKFIKDDIQEATRRLCK